jgi:hypothetical protein
MNRRRLLRAGVGSLAIGVAGCTGGSSRNGTEVRSPTGESTATSGQEAPEGVYVQSVQEDMYVVGMNSMDDVSGMNSSDEASGRDANGTTANGVDGASNTNGGTNRANSSDDKQGTNESGNRGDSGGAGTAAMPIAGDYRFGLMYAAPHVFWNVNGTELSKTPIEEGDSLHLMSVVWDPETQMVLPDVGLSVEINRNDELVSEEVIYPMFSQRMGFHYGANFGLPEDGTYTAQLSVGGTSIRRTGAFEGRFGEPASVAIEFPFTEETRDQVSSPPAPRAGEPGAIKPMEMAMLPTARVPMPENLPGSVQGTAESDGAKLVVTVLDAPPTGVDGNGQYLAVSARTPYNRLVLPAMALSGTLVRGGETIFEGALQRTLDPALNYHYGAALGKGSGVESGDELTLSIETPPQVARHEGYETAFLDMPDVGLSL